MDLGHYILEGHAPVHVPVDYDLDHEAALLGLFRWARWLEEHRAECIVARTYIGDYEIATDFLGLDHGQRFLNPNAPPVLFETLVFSGFRRKGHTGQMERCATWAEAEAQHARVAAAVKRMVDG